MSTLPPAFAEKMGDDAEPMRRTMKAVSHLLDVHAAYSLAEENSAEETMIGEMVATALVETVAIPDKAQEVLQCLMALVIHMRLGFSYASFFADAGIQVQPVINRNTGESL